MTALEEAVAVATSEVRLVAQVARAASGGNWRAAAWLLERRFPGRWGPRREREEPPLTADPDDPLLEFDMLAERRRQREAKRPPGY